jgi:hypothetical protein
LGRNHRSGHPERQRRIWAAYEKKHQFPSLAGGFAPHDQRGLVPHENQVRGLGCAHHLSFASSGRIGGHSPPCRRPSGVETRRFAFLRLCRRHGENMRGAAKICAGRGNFRRARRALLLRRVPESVVPTLLDSDRQNPRSGSGRLQIAVPVCRGTVWRVSNYGAFRKSSGAGAKANPDLVPICVTMFSEQHRVVTKGIGTWTRKS